MRLLPIAAFAAALLVLGGVTAFADPSCPNGADNPSELRARSAAAAKAAGARFAVAQTQAGGFAVVGVLFENYPTGAVYFFIGGCAAAQNLNVPPAKMTALFKPERGI